MSGQRTTGTNSLTPVIPLRHNTSPLITLDKTSMIVEDEKLQPTSIHGLGASGWRPAEDQNDAEWGRRPEGRGCR